MLARKSVPSGASRKVLNERLKASQKRESPAKESDSSSDSESFISASEGSSEVKNVENMFVLIGPVKDVLLAESSRSGANRLVHLSKQRDEPGSSAEETLAGLLKKVGASYDPKKRKATSQKSQNVPKPTKKRKPSSPKSTAPPVPNGRATRSGVRQSEADLQKALEESKKKKMEKGKRKVAESSEATEEEEMELVHQERGTTVEVPTPKPKKSKTSTKKSSCEPVSGEPLLAKRTRRKILKGRLLKDLEEPGMRRLVDALAAQGPKVEMKGYSFSESAVESSTRGGDYLGDRARHGKKISPPI
ncbi:PREDICTED: uncharacterized protein LOC109237818 [Nicotiana attenuata]|uniref:uncharacterized protein LOC109237818 n=1 Tax=Nicotiana attenuata TaxID=49451 RepID=UPI000904E47D|nr:PREDICTED: uncharacterized protein LOC109237818 [Nicotiana attenuata]